MMQGMNRLFVMFLCILYAHPSEFGEKCIRLTAYSLITLINVFLEIYQWK